MSISREDYNYIMGRAADDFEMGEDIEFLENIIGPLVKDKESHKPKFTVERVKGMIDNQIKGIEYNNAVLGGNDFCYKYGVQALKVLLKEINEVENDTRSN